MSERGDRLGAWCGWVMVGVAALTPLFAWLGPLGFAPLLSLAGLLCLPAVRVDERDRPLAILLLLTVAWAAASTFWSPHKATRLEDSAALKLAFQVLLYWSAWQGARRAAPAQRRLALKVFGWGLAAYGAVLAVEAMTEAGLYRALRDLIRDPIRPDLGKKNIAHGSFVLALLWPVVAAGAARAGASWLLAVPMAVGTALVGAKFGSDAPVLAVGLAVAAGVTVWIWPRSAPKSLAVATATLILLMPLLILAALKLQTGQHLPESWAQRVGYWGYALARLADHPFRGWGLDASRAFSPWIQLHPHNGALQLWLELGALGAVLGALVWAFVFRRFAGEARSLVAAGAAGSAMVYVLFGAISFGVWQEWWLAAAALTAAAAALADSEDAERRS